MTALKVGDRVRVNDKAIFAVEKGKTGTVAELAPLSAYPWNVHVTLADMPGNGGYTAGFKAEHLDVINDEPVKAIESDKVDLVNHPPHYTSHPSGVECIQITEHMGFNLGNALKYVWRADLKGSAVEDLSKAVFYINREIAKREKVNA